MVSLRAILQVVLTGLGLLLAAAGATLASSIDVPPGGGDIPTGFATLFSWGLTGVGILVFSLGVVLLDDTGLGSLFGADQRRVIRLGGGLLLASSLLPFAALLLLPLLMGALVGPGAGLTDTVFSLVLVGWLGMAMLGGLGIAGGIGWRLGEAILTWAHDRQTA